MLIVFGGTGFVGQHTAAELVGAGETVVVTSHVRRREAILLRSAVERGQAFVEAVELTDADQVMRLVAKYRPERIIDLSGYPPKELRPAEEVLARTQGTLNIFEAARRHDVSRVVIMSSMDAYWGLGASSVPYHEDMPVPLQDETDNYIVQSWAKKSLEVIASLYRRQLGLDIVTVRAAGLYGPLYRTFLNLPSRLIRAALAKALPDFGPGGSALPIAENGYDLLYVRDAATGLARIALAPQLQHFIYNMGSGHATTHGEVASAVEQAISGFAVTLRSRTDIGNPPRGREADMANVYLDSSRIAQELGFTPRFTLEQGIRDYVNWLREHPE